MRTEAELEHAAHPNYVGVFIVLGVLTAIEIGVATAFHSTIGKVPLLLALTFGKALLVALYYMHLKFDSRIFAFFFGMGIFVLAIPFTIILPSLLPGNPPSISIVSPRPESKPPPPSGQTAPGGNVPPVAFSTTATEFQFSPNTITVKPGQPINVSLTNAGTVQHNFTFPDANVLITSVPGKTSKGSFRAPGPGTYQFFCSIPGHREAGMVGTITVQ